MTGPSPVEGTSQPQWLSDVLTELSAYAEGYLGSRERTKRVLTAVPVEYLAAAGLAVSEDAPATLAEALGHADCNGTCAVCVDFRTEMEAIAENERQARIATRDVILGSPATEPRLLQPASFTFDEFTAWLAKNGISLRDTVHVEFITAGSARPSDDRAHVYLQVTRRARDDEGNRLVIHDKNGGRVLATETVLLPVVDLPGMDSEDPS